MCYYFSGGTPASRPNEAQLHFTVQEAEVALQHTHELLTAICGRWRSPLFPQPRRHQQMVGVKTLNIKQPPFIPPPRFPLAHELFFSVFWCFRLYLEANHEQLMAAKRSEGFSECWGFLDICYFP